MDVHTEFRGIQWIMVIFIFKFIPILLAGENGITIKTNDSDSATMADLYKFNASEKLLIPNNSILNEPILRNVFPESYFCGQIIGGHYMFGSASSYCGGFTVRDCSTQCFYRNFTYFQCEGLVCHCFS